MVALAGGCRQQLRKLSALNFETSSENAVKINASLSGGGAPHPSPHPGARIPYRYTGRIAATRAASAKPASKTFITFIQVPAASSSFSKRGVTLSMSLAVHVSAAWPFSCRRKCKGDLGTGEAMKCAMEARELTQAMMLNPRHRLDPNTSISGCGSRD